MPAAPAVLQPGGTTTTPTDPGQARRFQPEFTMALKKDKAKVLGEVFDKDRIRTFLDFEPPEGVDRDYHLLERAYRGMKVENFATFLDLFVEAGHDINATNPAGKTFLTVISEHRHAEEYLDELKRKGAQ